MAQAPQLTGWNGPVTTARLLIRPWQRADLTAYGAWPPYPDPLFAIFNAPQRSELELDLEWAVSQLDPRYRGWTILLQDDVVGRITLRARPGGEYVQLGMQLGSPYVDRGYGSEALHALLAAGFAAQALPAVRLEVACWNRRARRLYDRLGFVTVRHYWQSAGSPAAFSFLRERRYAPLATCFRWTATDLYVAWTEMDLMPALLPGQAP